MKTAIKYILHKLFGFENYLYLFSIFKIRTLKWDKKEKDFFHFLSLLPANSVILDIGANIGIMTVHIAQKLPSSLVLCFEPMPANLYTLNRVVNHFNLSNVQIFPFALSNEIGEVEMVMPIVSKVRMQGLSHVLHQSITEFNEGETITVAAKVLDDMQELRELTKPLSGIKIDVENFEFFVLEGSKKLLQKHKPIVYAELWDNENRKQCFDLFADLNYKTMVVFNNKLIDFNSEIHQKQNFIFLPA
jgi:FkbM family methyltransferase